MIPLSVDRSPWIIAKIFNAKEGIVRIEEMDVFRLSHNLTLKIYNQTKGYPPDERFGLVSQMRRAASSIPMNLMEGSHRNNRKEYRQFVGIAKGSASELKYQLLLSNDLGYLNKGIFQEFLQITQRVLQMLEKLNSSLRLEKQISDNGNRTTKV
ncbi:MAG: four helix bundle protein [Candidatus Jettenia sp. CY-1]|nr:four helix bundle protein [Candidatus Jettenia sp.]WKZ19603.1 MAG: four helix bundle protein [Candidatus Jettenia sp. CY-1]